jgi:hypothetical protein
MQFNDKAAGTQTVCPHCRETVQLVWDCSQGPPPRRMVASVLLALALAGTLTLFAFNVVKWLPASRARQPLEAVELRHRPCGTIWAEADEIWVFIRGTNWSQALVTVNGRYSSLVHRESGLTQTPLSLANFTSPAGERFEWRRWRITRVAVEIEGFAPVVATARDAGYGVSIASFGSRD